MELFYIIMAEIIQENNSINITEYTSIQTIFLFVLHKHPSITGSQIVEVIENVFGKDWVPTAGTIYKILKKLDKDGCIDENTSELNLPDGRKKTYKLTSCGFSFVKQQSDRMLRLVAFLYDCCPEYSDDFKIVKVCKTDCC